MMYTYEIKDALSTQFDVLSYKMNFRIIQYNYVQLGSQFLNKIVHLNIKSGTRLQNIHIENCIRNQRLSYL